MAECSGTARRRAACGRWRGSPPLLLGVSATLLMSRMSAGQIGPAPPGESVRVAYIIPSNRSPQPDGVATLRHTVCLWHAWYAQEMYKYGFGSRSFDYETESDGRTPRIYVVPVSQTDEYLRGDVWNRVISAAAAAGVPVWTSGQLWVLVPEIHLENSDGSIVGGVALGAGFGSGGNAGVGMIGSDALATTFPANLTNNAAYHNQILPAIGPYPLVQSVSFPWFEGNTFSSVSSAHMGAGLHEMSHGLGLGHDFRNDANFHGNLMGNGLRGFRGAAFRHLYPNDENRLGYAAALVLNVSRYFQPGSVPGDDTLPTVTVSTSGTVTPVGGKVVIEFSASDATGLAAALLRLGGDTIDEMPLTGTSVSTSFATPHYSPGASNNYQVSVYDLRGNRRNVDRTLTPMTGLNRAPRPNFKVTTSTIAPGATLVFDAGATSDPDHAASTVTVEWDLDGDGVFDTAPTTVKTLTTSFSNVGIRRIGLRATDPAGASTLATPIAVHVQRVADVNDDGFVNVSDLLAVINAWGACPPLPALCPADVAPQSLGDGGVNISDLLLVINNWG